MNVKDILLRPFNVLTSTVQCAYFDRSEITTYNNSGILYRSC